MEGHRGSLSILGHFMSVVEVVGEGRLLVFVHQVWVAAICSYSHSQQTVNGDVCIPVRESQGAGHQLQRQRGPALAEACSVFLPPNRRGEVCING